MKKLCEYGCGQEAKYQFKNGKWCCKKDFRSCEGFLKSKFRFGKKYRKPDRYFGVGICNYGCNQKANYIYLNGSLCCSDHYNKCIYNKQKLSLARCGDSNPMYNKKHSNKTIKLMRKLQTGEKNAMYGKKRIVGMKTRKKISLSNKRTIKQIKKRYPFFAQIEEMRYNPDKPDEKEIQVHCKNHNCPNSKEQGGWFTLIGRQIELRIYELETGNDGGYFYCSEDCKEQCPLFNLKSDPLKETQKPFTQAEKDVFNKEVLERQKEEDGYNFCEICYSIKNLHVHHEKPVKTHPLLALDPDNGIILCEECHYKYGHKTGTECSTGNLANNTQGCTLGGQENKERGEKKCVDFIFLDRILGSWNIIISTKI